MRTDVRPQVLPYAAAMLAVVVAFTLRAALTPWLGHHVPFLLFYPAFVVAAWLGGLGPGLLATALGGAAALLIYRAPAGTVPPNFGSTVSVVNYFLIGAMVSVVCEQLHRSRRRAERSAAEAERHAAEAARSAAEAGAERVRAADILESVTDAFYALDHDWRYTYVNRRCEQYYGKRRDEVLGRVVWDVFPVAVGTAFDREFRRAVRDRVAVDFEVLSPHSHRWVEVHAYPSAAGLSVYFREVHERKAAEAALEASERRLTDILDNAPVVVFMKDLAGRFVMVNRRYETLFGVDRAQVIGKTVYDIHPPAVADALAANDRAVLAAGAARELEELVPVPRDGTRTFLSAKFPLRDAAGVPYATCGIAKDITLRKRAETAVAESDARKAAVLRAALDCIVTVDHAGRVVEWNPAAEQTFGHPAGDAVGRDVVDLVIPPADRDRHRAALARWARTGHSPLDGRRVEVTAARADGSEFPAELAMVRIPLDGAPLFTGYLRDITHVKQAEAHRARAEAEQAQTAAERERLLANARTARDEAERASRTKDQFLAVLSHELRTPLTPVLAAVTHLEAAADLPAVVRNDLSTIRRNVQMEARLIDDLLDLTRIARGMIELHLEVTDAHAVAREAARVTQADADAKGVTLDLQLGAGRHHVWGDPGRLQQVVWNLLSNAVKFTPAGGRVTLRTTDGGGGASRRESPAAPPRVPVDIGSDTPAGFRLEVADTGVGIDPDVIGRIFDAFEQGERTVSRRFGGLGLGLAIARALARMHDGTLSAHSPGPGRGATFALELPAVAAPTPRPLASPLPAADHATGGAAAAAPAARLLLVEDHADTLDVVSRLLRLSGYDVTTADCVADAADHLAAADFDLLVSDIGLPDGSGTDVMELARAKGVRGIALSGFGTGADVARSRAAGFAEHLTKPIDFARLEAVVRRLAAGPTPPDAADATAAATRSEVGVA